MRPLAARAATGAILALLLALIPLAKPSFAQSSDKEQSKADKAAAEKAKEDAKKAAEEAKKAEAAARKQAERDSKDAMRDARREDKEPKAKKKGKQTKDERQRELVETGARTAIEWYGIALQRYRAGRYLDARSILLPLEDSPRAVDIQEKVKLLIADTYFEQGGALNLTEALARYKTFLTFYPSSEHAAYAQYQLGRSYFKQLGPSDRDQSFTENAIVEYERLIELHPDTEYARRAEKDILEAKALRASHEFEVAKFYWDWEDKTACATRLMTVLKERPELPEREQALYMAAQSLYDIGRAEEADAYAARLAADYPATQYSARLNRTSSGAVQKAMQREEKDKKQAERTHRAQLQSDRRRTKQIRRDSGLPGDVPLVAVPVEASEKDAGARREADERAAAKLAEREKQEREQAEAREREEQERAAKQKERDEKADAKAAAEDAKAAEKAANETPGQKAEREKLEARRQKEVERLEAEERRAAEKEAAAAAKREEKRAKEQAKKDRKAAAKDEKKDKKGGGSN